MLKILSGQRGKIAGAVFSLLLLLPAGLVLAQGNGPGFLPLVNLDCEPPDCGFEDLIQLARNVLDFLIYLSIMLAVALFVYAGFVYVTAAGSQEKITHAHGVFKKVAIGFLIVLSAWLIIDLILHALTGAPLYDPYQEDWLDRVLN